MTGFRSGASGSLIKRAKAARRTMGKRKGRYRGKWKFLPAPPVSPSISPPSYLPLNNTPQKEIATTPPWIMAQESKPPLNLEPIRPAPRSPKCGRIIQQKKCYQGKPMLLHFYRCISLIEISLLSRRYAPTGVAGRLRLECVADLTGIGSSKAASDAEHRVIPT